MPLHLRRRGAVWHIRGTVRIGRQTVEVPEFSSGCSARADAEAVAEDEAARIRGEVLDGPAGRARRLTIADCLAVYLKRPGGVTQNDQDKIADINERIGARKLDEAPAAWGEMLRTRGEHWSPGTAARWRAILQAAIKAGCDAHQAPLVRLPTVHEPLHEIVAYLTIAEQERLLAAYNKYAAPVALVLCFAGLRTQEALRMDWRHIDWRRETMFIPGAQIEDGTTARRTKSGRGRSVPMHPRVRAALFVIWTARKEPDTGPVFLSHRGEPYRDTRGVGGNPLAKAHTTACIAAGLCRASGRKDAEGNPVMVPTFRVHDWRHHWASHMIMRGTDLYTLMRLGGWTTPRMVQRYAAVTHDHMAEAIGRLQ